MSTESSQTVRKPSYFLVSVSTRENLNLCIEYGLAGFPGGENGAWTFCEIEEGDLVSFLYGAELITYIESQSAKRFATLNSCRHGSF